MTGKELPRCFRELEHLQLREVIPALHSFLSHSGLLAVSVRIPSYLIYDLKACKFIFQKCVATKAIQIILADRRFHAGNDGSNSLVQFARQRIRTQLEWNQAARKKMSATSVSLISDCISLFFSVLSIFSIDLRLLQTVVK